MTKKSSMAIKPEGGGGKALMARPLREELFFAASLREGTKASKFIICTNFTGNKG